jgi:hypothetical protein
MAYGERNHGDTLVQRHVEDMLVYVKRTGQKTWHVYILVRGAIMDRGAHRSESSALKHFEKQCEELTRSSSTG